MTEEEPCNNENRGLLQDCLPGVTLHNSHAYYHNPHPSDLSSPHPQEIDQLQQQILISKVMNSKVMNKMSFDDGNEHSTALSSVTSSRRDPNNITSMDESSAIRVLWIDKDSNIDGYSDDDEFDDIGSYSFSIRRAAAKSEANRRLEERRFLYLKCFFIAVFFYLLWDEFHPTKTKTKNTPANVHKQKVRLNKRWHKKVNSMYVGQQDGRDDDDNNTILTVLKDLDEAMHGDIVLRSNKTKFLDAARVWRRQDCVIDEDPSSLASPSNQTLPPLAVVEATSVEDVQLAVPILGGLARDYRLDFRVRSGGYAYMSGYSTVSDGVMLSLAKLNTITMKEQKNYGNNEEAGGIVNATKAFGGKNETAATRITSSKYVIIGPGVRTEDFMKEVLDNNGYSGIVASAAGVGMGGFILGGGYGLQSRMYGLAIDNVLGLEVVLPSGEVKEVEEDDDLFWALCGAGGGNIGVVTSMAYQVYPSHDIKLAARVKVSLLEMTQFLQRVGDNEFDLAPEFTLSIQGYSPNNDTATGFSQHEVRASTELNTVNEGGEEEENWLVTISMYWMGDSNPDNPVGMQYIKNEIVPLFSSNSTIDDIAYYYFSWSGMSREREQNPELKSVWSAQSWNGFLLPSNNTQEVWTDIQSSLSAMFTYCKFVSPKVELWGGAISKVLSNATVFPHRNAIYNIGIDLIVPTESDADAAADEMHLVNAIWPSISRHLNGVYVNYPMASLSNESYPTAYWGENLDRLMVLTKVYDPSRVLRVAQGVPIRTNDTIFPTH